MKNPYLKLFYLVFIESHNRTLQTILTDFDREFVINLFDFVTVCCKFLDSQKLQEVLKTKVRLDIERGNLQVFALIGLKSE